MRVIAVEGNIGAGKSTMLPELAEKLGFKFLQEPADDPIFLELLNSFTANPHDTEKRLEFQQYITATRAKLLNEVPDDDYVIERSLFSDLIFSQVNMLGMERPDGKYLSYFYDIKSRLKEYPRVDAVVYLKTNPLTAFQRMQSRDRKEESGTPLDYLIDVHNFHEACLPQICREYKTPLVTVDWNNFGSAQDIIDNLKMRMVV